MTQRHARPKAEAIAHRLSTIEDCGLDWKLQFRACFRSKWSGCKDLSPKRGDVILVVSDGQVAEYGTHTELMERKAGFQILSDALKLSHLFRACTTSCRRGPKIRPRVRPELVA